MQTSTATRTSALRSSHGSSTTPRGARSSRAWGFEKFDGAAGGVIEQDLLAAETTHDVVAEVCPRVAQSASAKSTSSTSPSRNGVAHENSKPTSGAIAAM